MARVTKPGGLVLVATPNRKAMIDGVNPYHYKEFSARELEAALKKVFREVQVQALFGSDRYLEIKREEQGFAKKILAFDFLRLRRLTPRFILRVLYKRAYEAVNRRTESLPQGNEITIDDFWVSPDGADQGLDLIGVCRK